MMGGNGSGRQGGRPTVERTNSIVLSIHKVMRDFDGVNQMTKRCTWPDSIDGEMTATIRPQETHPPLVELRYRFDHFSRDTGPQIQYIDVGWSPCPFGGRRWWWHCPKSDLPVTKLYLPNGGIHFWSRQAYRLGYLSTRETWLDRARRKSGKLHRKLGWDYDGPTDFLPDKPKGMHWRTYNALCDRIDAVEQVIDSGFAMRVGRLLAKHGSP